MIDRSTEWAARRAVIDARLAERPAWSPAAAREHLRHWLAVTLRRPAREASCLVLASLLRRAVDPTDPVFGHVCDSAEPFAIFVSALGLPNPFRVLVRS